MTFFQDLPVPEPLPRGKTVRYVPPSWAGARADFLLAGDRLARSSSRTARSRAGGRWMLATTVSPARDNGADEQQLRRLVLPALQVAACGPV
ncbi:hypothetical protein E2R57_16220 [Arthrobacter nitrophenolicus]|uniref:Uncharacterized protein n=1 Tax=Arthrobacter nitrophenolicus TaxID=683150 RepID=A0A4R5XST9_9MICC|nr:hypothetical protein E2R57_16220 [Arthrobacter nitrophenolicus]